VIPVPIVARTLAKGVCRRLLLRPQRTPSTARRILFPQKQLGSIRSGVGPTTRNRISVQQRGFGHAHHSSSLFTNVTSARFNAPRDASFRRKRRHNTERPEVSASAPRPLSPIFGSSITHPAKKDSVRL
jgi:hypothetical protein